MTLSLRSVKKQWAPSTPPVLDGIDLEVRAGSLVVVEGANGTGKTTMLRIVSRILDPDAGEVRVNDRTAVDDPAAYQAALGTVTAGNTGLYNRLNALQHLQFAARLGFVPRPRRAPQVRRMFDAFGLMEFGGRRVDRLSMGQRQRLRLAMAFVHAPSVVLLDEPTTSLDTEGVHLLEAALAAHLRDGRAAVWFGPTGLSAPDASERHCLRLAGGALSPC